MKTERIILIVFSVLATVSCVAQKNKKTDAEVVAPAPVVAEMPESSQACLENVSLFAESAKYKNYADALAPWESAYAECPRASRAIYTYGVRIISWQIEQENDVAKKDALVDKLMKLYDDQIKYFGTDSKQPTAYLLGMKAYYSLLYRPADYAIPYTWLKESVNALGLAAQPGFLQQFVIASSELYKAGKLSAETFIQDYLYSNDLVETNAANESLKNASDYAQVDQSLDFLFVQSGVADCNQLDKIYGAQVTTRSKDLDFLNSTIRFYKRLGCNQSDVFFKAAQYAHIIKPTSESANGCAEMCYKKEEFSKAIDYYREGVSLATSDKEAADYLLKIAQIYNSKLNNSLKSREYARLSLERNPNQGAPYLLIGILYANTRNIYDSPTLNKTVYWVAVDKFRKAQQVEPTAEMIEKVNDLINTYSRYFPSKEEVFFEPDLGVGKTFVVGGWIGEATTCR